MHEACDRVMDYLSGEMNEDERSAFEAHLAECEKCREEVEELQGVLNDLPYATEPVEPPKGMKHRVFEQVFQEDLDGNGKAMRGEHEGRQDVASLTTQKQEKHTRQPWTALLAAGLLLSLSGNVYSFLSNEENAGSQQVVESIDEVTNKVTLSGEETAGSASASFIRQNESFTLVVEADQLQDLQGDEVYQVWLINDKTPYRAGSFVTNQNGDGAVAFSLEKLQEQGEFNQIAISREPDATSETPRGEILLTSDL